MPDWTDDIRALLDRKRTDPAVEWEIVEELSQHLDDRYDELINRGLEPADARAQALAELDVAGHGSLLRRSRRRPEPPPPAGSWWGGLIGDLKYGARRLTAAPAFTLASVLMLAVGIGASSVMYVFIGGVLRGTTPPVDLDARVALWSFNASQSEPKMPVSFFDFDEWSRRTTSLDLTAAMRRSGRNLAGSVEPVRVTAAEVSHAFFEMTGTRLILGRGITAEDERSDAPVAVISGRLWMRSFDAAPDIIGRTVRVDGVPVSVIGVTARSSAENIVLYLPLKRPGGEALFERNLIVFGRLKAGVPIDRAREDLRAAALGLSREHPDTHEGWGVNVTPMAEEYLGTNARIVFSVLAAAVLSLLLIGCVNVANLILARGVLRGGEFSLRLALGATRAAIRRQLLVESLLLSVLAGIAGIVVSLGGLAWMRSVAAFSVFEGLTLEMDLPTLAVTMGIAVASVVVFGFVPALRTSLDEGIVAGVTARTTASHRNLRLRSVLIGGEVAVAAMLMIVTGLLLRTLINLEAIQAAGFNASNVLTATVTLPDNGYNMSSAMQLVDRLTGSMKTSPGVVAAAATTRIPAAGSRWNPNRTLRIEGRPPSPESPVWAMDLAVSPDYFETLEVPVHEGREFQSGDSAGAPLVALVNRTMATRYWPGQSPVGSRIQLGGGSEVDWRTIVGVVGDIRNDDLDSPTAPHVFVPLAQRPALQVTIVLRTAGWPEGQIPELRAVLSGLDPDLPLYDVRSLQQVLNDDIADSRALIHILGSLSAVAFLLAASGVYSVVSYNVNQRLQEIGVRMALGATAPAVIRRLLAQGLKPVAIGLGTGLLAGLGISTALRTVLYEVPPGDPATFVSVAVVFAAAATGATLLPAWRASRRDPLESIRPH